MLEEIVAHERVLTLSSTTATLGTPARRRAAAMARAVHADTGVKSLHGGRQVEPFAPATISFRVAFPQKLRARGHLPNA